MDGDAVIVLDCRHAVLPDRRHDHVVPTRAQPPREQAALDLGAADRGWIVVGREQNAHYTLLPAAAQRQPAGGSRMSPTVAGPAGSAHFADELAPTEDTVPASWTIAQFASPGSGARRQPARLHRRTPRRPRGG